jgi:hypothetical protein
VTFSNVVPVIHLVDENAQMIMAGFSKVISH